MLEKMEEFDQEKVIEFEALTKDAERVQRETLKKILEENGSAEYLQSIGLNERTDIGSFRACVPLVTHQDLEHYIRRIVDGDSSPILTGKPITTISLSQQQLGSSTKVHTALGFLILALLALLQVKYQNSGNPFQTHGAIMSSFIVLVIGYSITLAWISQPALNTSCLHIGRSVCVIFATSASGLLVEILLPPLGFFILAICALMFAQLLCVSHQEILQCFQEIFQSINQYTSEAFKTLCGWVQNGFQSLKQAASKAFNSSS